MIVWRSRREICTGNLKEAGMEDCNATLCPMEPGLKLSKKDEPVIMLILMMDEVLLTRFLSRFITYYMCSQKKTIVALSSCEAEFTTATAAVCQAIWLRKLLSKVTGNEQVIFERKPGDNQRAYPLRKALARIRFKEIRSLLGVQKLPSSTQKFRG
nr:hypothetical protein [Tanacetum cinerariifolium]